MSGLSAGADGDPDPRLRPYAGRYSGYRLSGFAPGVHIGMPGTGLVVILTVDEPIDLPLSPHPLQPGGVWDALASGLTVRPCHIRHTGYQHGIQLDLTPAGARALLGVPAAELGSWLVDLSDLLGAGAGELRERIAAQPDWSRRFAVLDEFLLRRVGTARTHAPAPALTAAWRALTAAGTPGAGPRVAAVAAGIGWSRRHLAARFGAEFGLTPSEAVRLARFERSHRMLRRPGVTIAGVAAATGYYDQAHLARDWRAMAGTTPSRWLAEEVFPFVQAEPAAELTG